MQWALPVVALLVLGADPKPDRAPRIYDIRFLTAPIPHFPAKAWPEAGRLVLRGSDQVYGEDPLDDWESRANTSAHRSFDFDDTSTPGKGLRPEALVEVVRRNIAEDSWENSQNIILATPNELSVVHTTAVHAQIEALLAELRERRALMIRVDVAVVPYAAVAPLREEESIRLPDGGFEEAVARAADAGTVVSLTAYNEQIVSAFSGKRRTALVDTEVNQTGVLPVASPVIDSIPLGVTVEALPRALLGAKVYSVALQVERLREVGALRTRGTFFADLQFQNKEEHSLKTTLILAPRQTVVAGFLRVGGGVDDFAVIVRIAPYAPRAVKDDSAAPAQAIERQDQQTLPEQEFTQRLYDVGFLVESDGNAPPHLPAELLVSMIQYQVEPESWRDERTTIELDAKRSALAITARAPTHKAVGVFLQERTNYATRLSIIEVWEIEGPIESVDAFVTADPEAQMALLTQHALDGPLQERAYAFVVAVVGKPARLGGYRSQSFLGDVAVASGGTGFSILEMPDPVVESTGDGVRIQARIDATPLDTLARLDLAYGRYETTIERSARLVTSGAIGPGRLPPTSLPKDNTVAQIGAAADTDTRSIWIPWEVDLPSQKKVGVTVKHAVAIDPPRVLQVSSAADGRARAVVSRTRYTRVKGEEDER